MSKLKDGELYIEVCQSQSGGFSLCIGDDDTGHRLTGGKVGGMPTIHRFKVKASELIEQAKAYSFVKEQPHD